MKPCACGCGTTVKGTYARGHRLRMPGVASSVRAHMTPVTGAAHPKWRGGMRIHRGYRLLWRPDHPMASGGYVAEHRLVMAKHLGRMLTSREQVHHRNHDKLDNALENLVIYTRPAHMREHRAEGQRGRRPGWEVHPDGCLRCGTKDRKHRGNGFCSACYEWRRRRIAKGLDPAA